jgi:hypothetical protein
MSDEDICAIGVDAKWQHARAQACLDLFEKDCGRRAATTSEVRAWASAQDREQLQFRVKRRLMAAELWVSACNRIWSNIPAPLVSRPPKGQRIFLTLAEAAAATGQNESTIMTAIKDGRITASKDILGEWHIERARLLRVFPPSRGGAAATTSHSDSALDAAALVLELEITALISRAGDALRERPPWWRRLVG